MALDCGSLNIIDTDPTVPYAGGASLLTEDQSQMVLNEVRRHYQERSQPYYLSDLGQFFRSKDVAVPAGKRFKDFLSETFRGLMEIVQDPLVPARIAIALPENREQVQQQLAGRLLTTPDGPSIGVNRLPFSLIAAFYQKPESGNRVYYRTVSPFRYAIAEVPPDESFIEVDERFRQSLSVGMSLREISSDAKQETYRRIVEWAAAKAINLETISVRGEGRAPSAGTRRSLSISNALQRLIEAQEPGMRKRLQVPGDIALALMRME